MDHMLTIIPARGGSKGVPGKNIKVLGNMPLIAHTVRAAIDAGLTPVVSTDDQAIADAALEAGALVPGLRPAELATDTSTSLEVVLHALGSWAPQAQAVCLLQPTSPFRTTAHIQEAMALFEQHKGQRAVVSVTPVEKPPRWMFRLDDSCVMSPFMNGPALTRRQDAAPLMVLNGALYIVPASVLEETGAFVPEGALGYVMSHEASLDIDTPLDWKIAEALWPGDQSKKG